MLWVEPPCCGKPREDGFANIQFLNIPDGIVPEADIRVGVSALTNLG
jgi:hypothetical protein